MITVLFIFYVVFTNKLHFLTLTVARIFTELGNFPELAVNTGVTVPWKQKASSCHSYCKITKLSLTVD